MAVALIYIKPPSATALGLCVVFPQITPFHFLAALSVHCPYRNTSADMSGG